MYYSHFKVARRNLLKYRSYTLLNILGLSAGLACFMFIWMYVQNELDYDKGFDHYQQIYRIGVKGEMAGSKLNQAVTAAPLAGALRREVNGVVTATSMLRFGDWLVRYQDKRFNEPGVVFADSCFFDVFSYRFIYGDPLGALDRPKTVVLSEETAFKYFGKDDPTGKLLQIESDSTFYEVTGVVKVPANAHFHFDFMASLTSLKQFRGPYPVWISHMLYTYALLEKDYNLADFQASLDKLVIKYVVPQVESILGISIQEYLSSGNKYSYFYQPLTDIHLHSNLQVEFETNGNLWYVTIFTLAAILILLIACINFMNLATAQSSQRAREVAVRKILGSSHKQLIFQFIFESLFLAFLAFAIALVIVELLTPYYDGLIHKNISLITILTPLNSAIILGVVIFSGILSGSYPAFVIASYQPLLVLKGNLKNSLKSTGLRNYLVILQFFISVLIMICTCAIYRQLTYMQHRDLGFDKERALVIRRSDGLKDNLNAFKAEISSLPGVLAVGNSTHIPGRNYWYNSFFKDEKSSETFLLYQCLVSPGFDEALGLKMKAGRFFSETIPADSFAVVINEAAAQKLGYPHPLGKFVYMPLNKGIRKPAQIIGVVQNFNFKSLHYKVEPMILTMMRSNIEGYIVVRLKGRVNHQTIEAIHQKWDEFTADYPFEYFWLKDDFAKLFDAENQIFSIFLSFSAFSIFIACLGLFGLIAFTATMRMREIGIRKAMGATFEEIVLMLTANSLKMVGIALLFAWPVSYLVIQWWLKSYSFQIPMNYIDFVLVAFICIFIAFVTIFFQAAKAAGVNPATAIHYE